MKMLRLIKIISCITLVAYPLLTFGQTYSQSNTYLDFGNSTVPMIKNYHDVPNRFFILKSPDFSRDYIYSLINQFSDSPFEICWCFTEKYKEDLCRIIVNDAEIDNIISNLLINEAVLTARRIYVEKTVFDNYVSFVSQIHLEKSLLFVDPNLRNEEIFFLNDILCVPRRYNPELIPIDSICDALGVSYELIGRSYNIKIPRYLDIFNVAHQLHNTDYFIRVDVNRISPDAGTLFEGQYGTRIIKTDHSFFYHNDSSKEIYYKIPDRLFVQKQEKTTQESVNNLLISLGCEDSSILWLDEDICELIVDETKNSNFINELIKDNRILLARNKYVSKNRYDHLLYYPDLAKGEVLIFNEITCFFDEEQGKPLLNDIIMALGLTIQRENKVSVIIKTPKNCDIFEVSQKLFESGLFTEVIVRIDVNPKEKIWGGSGNITNVTTHFLNTD